MMKKIYKCMLLKTVLIFHCSYILSEEILNDVIVEVTEDIYTQASSCQYRFNMGCMLDVLEKACTGLKDVEACAKHSKCEDLGELERLLGALRPKNFESIYRCCCTKAYKEGGYEKCDNPNPICAEAVDKYITNDEVKEHWKIIKPCARKPSKQNCEKALLSINWAIEAIQKVRGEMWPTEGCTILAPPEPYSICGWDVKPESRAIERSDLYCDTIIWQYKEMGASDHFMSQCPNAPKMVMDEEEIIEGEFSEKEDHEDKKDKAHSEEL